MLREKWDSIIVLSHHLTPDRELSLESMLRVDEGVRLFKEECADFVIMNGGPGKFTEMTSEGLYVPLGTYPVQCDVMAEYAKKQGLPADRILIQNISRETVGEIYFVKELILAQRGWYKNIIITCSYHIERVRAICAVVLGSEYIIKFWGIVTDLDNDRETLIRERNSKEIFSEQFGNVKPGNSSEVERALYTHHKLYATLREEEKIRFVTRTAAHPQA